MNQTEANSPTLDAVFARLSIDPKQVDTMQRECCTLAGAKKPAAWLMENDQALRSEFTVEALAGLLLNKAKHAVGVFANVGAFVGKP